MGQKDLAMQQVLMDKKYFADICNMMLWHGEQAVRPEQLRDMEASIVNSLEEVDGRINAIRRIRDSVKELEIIRMEDYNAAYIILGIEHQSKVDYSMPVRSLLYDAMQYENQVQQMRSMNLKARLKPVITMVVYTGESRWNYPLSLRDVLDMRGLPDELRAYILDTKLPVLDVRHSQNLDLLSTGLKQVFHAMQLYRDKEEFHDYISRENGFDRIPGKLANMLEKILNLGLPEYEAEKEVNMCEAMEGIKNDVRELAQLEAIRTLGETLGLSPQEAMNALKIPPEVQKKYQQLVGQPDAPLSTTPKKQGRKL